MVLVELFYSLKQGDETLASRSICILPTGQALVLQCKMTHYCLLMEVKRVEHMIMKPNCLFLLERYLQLDWHYDAK